MNRLRNRLILVFLAATLIPLAATLWLTSLLLEHSLAYSTTRELDQLSRSLERAGRELYQRARESVKAQALAGRLAPHRHAVSARAQWPDTVESFWGSGEGERFELLGPEGGEIEYLVRRPGEVLAYRSGLGGVGMHRLAEQYSHARRLVEEASARDLRRGFTYTFLLLASSTWLISLALLVFLAHRISRPIHQLTAALSELGRGNLSLRLETGRRDEVGEAMRAFNRMAAELEAGRERLLYLARLESWQALARKTAHEVKNSLTPIRLTMEEMVARDAAADRAFLAQAAQIVVEEVNSLERRVRAFSELAAEPPVHPAPLDVNAVVEERVAFLRGSHPAVVYEIRPAPSRPLAWADSDLVKGVLTNLLENAAQAAGDGGVVLCQTRREESRVLVEVHDSGPGLSPRARATLFEPTISFKKGGMGLGLSIARKSALLAGGDILLVEGELGGAGFRVLLPAFDGDTAHPDRR